MTQPSQPARYGFHSGSLWTIPGVTTLNPLPTPQKFGVLQDGAIDLSFSMKDLYGQMVAPVAVGVSQLKITGHAKFARLRGAVLRDLFFPGMTSSVANQGVIIEGESVAITALTGTIAHVSGAVDLGVYYTDGTPLTKVSTLSAIGQYTWAAGVITLYTGDTAAHVLADYQYTGTSGNVLTVSNAAVGLFPSFQCVLQVLYGGVPTSLQLFAAQSTKLNFNTKQGDFVIPQFDFAGFADASGNILAFGGEL